MRGTPLSLLRANRGFRALWLARTVSYLGDFITATVVVLYLYEAGASPVQLGLALAARAVPQVLGPVTGAMADRWDPRMIMVTADVARCAAVATIALILPPFPVLIALIVVTSTLTTFFLPAGKSCVPRLVNRRELVRANSLLGFSHNVALATGPLIGAVLIDAAGARVAFAVDAGSYLISASVLLLIPRIGTGAAAAGATSGPTTRFLTNVLDGLRYVAGHRVARGVGVSLFLGVFFAAMDSVALVYLIRDDNGADAAWVGVATGGYGLAMVLVPMLIAVVGWQPSGARLLLLGLACSAGGLVAVGVSGSLVLIVACYAIAGAGNGLENIAVDTAVGENVDVDMLGRVFGAIYGPIFLAETAAYLVSGPLLTATSPATVFLVAGSGLVGVIAVSWVMLRHDLRPAAAVTGPGG